MPAKRASTPTRAATPYKAVVVLSPLLFLAGLVAVLENTFVALGPGVDVEGGGVGAT